MNMKKIASVALAGAMALSLAVPAFAADPDPVKILAETSESEFQVELEGMIYTPVIRVQVTETGNVYVNPSKGTVAGTMTKALDGTGSLDYSFDSMGVVSTPILIRSDTDKALKVQAKATATVPKTSGITIKADKTAVTKDTDTKDVFLFVTGNPTALGNSNDLATVTDTDTNTVTAGLTKDKITSTASTTASKATAVLAPGSDGKTAEGTGTEVAKIDAADVRKDATGKIAQAIPQYGVVMIAGESAGAAKWGESDIVNVSVALTFAIDNT